MVDFTGTRGLRAPASEAVLDHIVHTIVERLHPRRLILFGSRARGDAHADSDFDVAVELDEPIASQLVLTNEILGYFPPNGWSLNVFLRSTGELERDADDPGTIDWDIIREGRVLYAADGVSRELAPATPLQVREAPPKIPASVRRWARRAASDLTHAQRSADMGDAWEHVCFHAHQAAEKYLKAVIVRQFRRPTRTHKLEDLLSDARMAGVGLSALDADCAHLTPYAISARYGDLENFDETMGRGAIAAADRIAEAILPLLE